MNKNYVLWHLDQAREAIGEIIADMKLNRSYEYGEYVADTTHVYHDLNTAWNATHECSQEDFYSWRQFPTEDVYLGK
jgi:hypothetical protein